MKTQQLMPLLIMVVLIAAMYFLMIRPQKKKQKQTQDMRNNLRVGDKIVTIGGIVGKIVKIYSDDTLAIETGTGTNKNRLEMKRFSISQVLEPGDVTKASDVTEKKDTEEEKEEEKKPKAKKPRKLN